MKTTTLHPLVLSALSATLLLAGCSKDKEEFGPNTTVSAEDHADAEGDDAATYEYVDAAAPEDVQRSGSGMLDADDQRILFGCASHSYDAPTRTLTIDFGPNGCVGRDGRLRKGQIVAVFSGQHRRPGSSVTTMLVGYSVNGNPRTGTRTVTFVDGRNFTVTVRNASITTPNGTATWQADRSVTQTAGLTTRSVRDDEYSITGSAAGTNRRGVSFTATIQQPLIKKFQAGCARHFVAGTLQIVTSNERTLLLNYDPAGTQACDNIATVTIGTRTRTIRLR
ncbi:hypothetical protein [Hymenobacter sp. B81]|uniref:hypothetical protein n=1 Tax=Hymenobacter sp. B81 TaxID=3344878 RepID=UPI0037DC0484